MSCIRRGGVSECAYLWHSWIQGHPEYGFNFEALVCYGGVFDVAYNGYSSDELFFVSIDVTRHPSIV